MARALVIGGSGYLGRELLVRARAGGLEAVGTRHAGRRHGDLVALDLRDAGAVGRLVADIRPDLVVNTAYVPSGPDLEAVTTTGAALAATAARAAGARMVHLSTDLVFDGAATRAYREDDPVRPIIPYGRAKARAERLVAEAHSGALVVRTSLIYGGAEPGPQEELVARALAGADVAFFRDEVRSPVQVGDLADAILALARTEASGIVNAAGADALSRLELARLMAARMGGDPGRLRGASSADARPPRPPRCVLDCSLLLRLTGRAPRGAREVLTAT